MTLCFFQKYNTDIQETFLEEFSSKNEIYRKILGRIIVNKFKKYNLTQNDLIKILNYDNTDEYKNKTLKKKLLSMFFDNCFDLFKMYNKINMFRTVNYFYPDIYDKFESILMNNEIINYVDNILPNKNDIEKLTDELDLIRCLKDITKDIQLSYYINRLKKTFGNKFVTFDFECIRFSSDVEYDNKYIMIEHITHFINNIMQKYKIKYEINYIWLQ